MRSSSTRHQLLMVNVVDIGSVSVGISALKSRKTRSFGSGQCRGNMQVPELQAMMMGRIVVLCYTPSHPRVNIIIGKAHYGRSI